MNKAIKAFILVMVCLNFVSCGSAPDKLDVNTAYKKDVLFWVNGKKMKGVGVAPYASLYNLYLEYPQGKIDILELITCHRHENIFNEGTKASYAYRPSEIELKDNCHLEIGIYDKKGRHGWGLLLFESPRFTLKAKVECNGESYVANGVSGCQSKIGMTQSITFDEPVTMKGDCKIDQDGFKFTYRMAEELCQFRFSNHRGEIHRALSTGFEAFPIRE